jgi:membrane peptidoglycan carboxypeptidase
MPLQTSFQAVAQMLNALASRDSAYNIHGFAEAAQVYFGKDLANITLPEAALMAGMVQRPSAGNLLRKSARAAQRRILVLSLMRDDRYISAQQSNDAVSAPLGLRAATPLRNSLCGAPWYMVLLHTELGEDRATTARPHSLSGPA